MTANGFPSAMAVRDVDAVQPKDQQRKRFNGSNRNGQNGAYPNGKEQKKDSHRRGGKDRHDRGGKGANKSGHKAASKFLNAGGKPGAPVTAAGLDVQLDPKSLLGISGDLSMASTATSTTDASGHLRDICMAHVITSLADKTIGNPALMLQRLLDFSPADYDDLLLALAESGCSYVDILAAYIHNLRVVAADQPPHRASASASGASPDSLAGGITEKFNELLSEITKASSSTGSGSATAATPQAAPTHTRRPSGGAGNNKGRQQQQQPPPQQQQQQGVRAATPDRRRNGERRERSGGPRTASPAPTAVGPPQHPKPEQQQPAAPAPRSMAGRPPHPPLAPQHHQQQQPLPPQAPPPQQQQQQAARQYTERPEAAQQLQQHAVAQQHQQHAVAAAAELQQHSSGEHPQPHGLSDHQQHQQQVAQHQHHQHHQYITAADMISPRASAAPAAAPAHLQQQQQMYLASLTATANAAMHDMHAGLLHPGMVTDRSGQLAPAAAAVAAPQAGAAKLRTYWSENLEDASRSFPARADSLQPQPSHPHLQSHHSSHLQSHESYGHPQQQQQQPQAHDAYGAPHAHQLHQQQQQQQQFQAPQHLGGSLAHATVPEEGPARHPVAEDSFPHPSSATAQYMAELQAAALHLMPMQQQHQQPHQQQHQQHQAHQPQVVLLPNGMPITLSPGGPSGSAGPDMSVLQLSGDPYGTAALGLSQMSSLLSVGSSHAMQLPSFHSEPLQWSTIWQ